MEKKNKEYYENLREQCLLLKDYQLSFGQDLIKYVYPKLREYELEIQGEENIPRDSSVLFLVNHSNSHDIFTAYEVLSALQRRGSVMVATDCLNPLTAGVFGISNATLLDRRKNEDRKNSILKLSKKILTGNDGVIFGEGTWNLHPILPMHNIRTGAATVASITQVPIIPTIFEYVEKNDLFTSESPLYKKCIIRFASPITIDGNEDIIRQTNDTKEKISRLREGIWRDYGIFRSDISDVDQELYLNHTYLKKFKAFGFTYDSAKEQEFLLFLGNESHENEYHLNQDGEFVPGVTEKNKGLEKVLQR